MPSQDVLDQLEGEYPITEHVWNFLKSKFRGHDEWSKEDRTELLHMLFNKSPLSKALGPIVEAIDIREREPADFSTDESIQKSSRRQAETQGMKRALDLLFSAAIDEV